MNSAWWQRAADSDSRFQRPERAGGFNPSKKKCGTGAATQALGSAHARRKAQRPLFKRRPSPRCALASGLAAGATRVRVGACGSPSFAQLRMGEVSGGFVA